MPDSRTSRIHVAIGDIHGHAERLAALHAEIFAAVADQHPGAALTLVHLGDYVDRGPDSAGVIARLRQMETDAAGREDLELVCLMGNHEQMMIDALENEGDALRHWAINGGIATLESYLRAQTVPEADLDWLKTRPRLHCVAEHDLIFVHAGVHPEQYPGESEEVYLWTRAPRFFDTAFWTAPALTGQRVIHGHTPPDDFCLDVSDDGRRINIDTGACYGGPLTAVLLAPGHVPQFLQV